MAMAVDHRLGVGGGRRSAGWRTRQRVNHRGRRRRRRKTGSTGIPEEGTEKEKVDEEEDGGTRSKGTGLLDRYSTLAACREEM
ncbi:hypothetical protein ALC62_11066 [Cyphomyrmex costatus]|uniref:Uncharacterized protein n=1 Tax=Cyphomyrmex costatus TaxID=456900 RepID=A0A151ICV4_9HYME|nr:hypothetical protein ALC62_11066 [Cyphomyrmex costatus]